MVNISFNGLPKQTQNMMINEFINPQKSLIGIMSQLKMLSEKPQELLGAEADSEAIEAKAKELDGALDDYLLNTLINVYQFPNQDNTALNLIKKMIMNGNKENFGLVMYLIGDVYKQAYSTMPDNSKAEVGDAMIKTYIKKQFGVSFDKNN